MTDRIFEKLKFLPILILVLISFLLAINVRENVYQEVDSTVVYRLLNNDREDNVSSYVAWSYGGYIWGANQPADENLNLQDIISALPENVLELLSTQRIYLEVHDKILPHLDYPTKAHQVRYNLNKILEQKPKLKYIPIHGIFRLALAELIKKVPLNRHLTKLLEFPLASTYTLGMSILYSAINSFTNDFQEFFAVSSIMTITFFHVSILFFFFMLRNLNLSFKSASIITLFVIFNASSYSYSFHLGSSIFTQTAFLFYFYYASSLEQDEFFFKKLGFVSSILVVFSYLAVILLAATIVCDLFSRLTCMPTSKSVIKGRLKSVMKLVIDHKGALFIAFTVLLLFYQPGQGVRGQIQSLYEIHIYIYLTILNLFSWLNSSLVFVNFLQFLVFFSIVIIAIYSFVRLILAFKSIDNFSRITVMVLTIYLSLLFLGQLNISPSRHMLFIQPLIILLPILLIKANLTHFNETKIRFPYGFLFVVLSFVGLWAHTQRVYQLYSDIPNVDFSPESKIVAPENFYSQYIPKSMILNTIEGNNTYIYISRGLSLDDWISAYNKNFGSQFKIKREKTIYLSDRDVSYMSFTPNLRFTDGRFAFNRKNFLHVVEFDVF